MGDRLQVFFLESSWQLGFVAATGAALWFAAWRQQPTASRFRLLLGWSAVSVALLVLQAVIRTDRERVKDACYAMAEAVDAGHMDTLAAYISETLSGPWEDKEGFMKDATNWLEQNSIDEANLDSMVVSVNESAAAASFRARARVQTRDWVWPLTFSLWDVRFQKESDGQWRVIRIRWKEPGRDTYRELLPYLR